MASCVGIVTHRLSGWQVVPRLVRLCVFKFAVLPFASAYERWVLDRWQNHFSGHSYCSTRGNFDLARAQRTIESLKKERGGEERWIIPRDREARLQTVWWAAQRRPGDPVRCVLLAKLAKSFAMNKFEITFFLDRGVDVVAYDPRGVVNSQGYPSEAGLYADIEAVGEAVVEKYGAENVWVYGSCGESFAAVALFRKYCHQGMHMLLLTAPGSLERVIGRLNRIVAWLFSWARWALGAPEGSQLKGQQREDGFDSLGKLRGLTGAKGRVVLASTVGDDTAPPEEVAEMGAALRQAGAEVTLFENRAEESRVRPGLTDPHLADPLRHPRFQELLVSKITQ